MRHKRRPDQSYRVELFSTSSFRSLATSDNRLIPVLSDNFTEATGGFPPVVTMPTAGGFAALEGNESSGRIAGRFGELSMVGENDCLCERLVCIG